MGEQVAKTAANLMPLLLVLLGIFTVLIVLAVLLRARIRAESSAYQRQRAAWQPERGEPCSVLGRAFNVQSVAELPEGQRLLELRGDDAQARMLLQPSGDSHWYFPGTTTADQAGGLPGEMVLKEQRFLRQGEPAVVSDQKRIATYRAEGDLLLLVEVRGDDVSVWRGKCIPREGFGPLEK